MSRVVVAHGAVLRVYDSIADARQSIDPRDAVGGAVRAWDATGRPLRIDVDDAVCLDEAHVLISLDRGAAGDPALLRGLLRDQLERRAWVPAPDASITDLLELAYRSQDRA